MLALAVSSLVSLFIFITYGYFVTRVARLRTGFAETALIGLAVANTIATIFSLFFPLNMIVTAILLVLGLAALTFIRDDLKALRSALGAKKKVIYCALPFILIAFFVALGSPWAFDTGLYHFQSIKWLEEYSVVPGLANLHGRFGFNPNIFTFSAAVTLVDIFKQEIFSVNFTVFAVLVLHFLSKMSGMFQRQGVTGPLLFNALIFADIIFTMTYLSTPSPNFLQITLPLFILSSVCGRSSREGAGYSVSYLPILILCVYALTVKLATIPLMVLFALLALENKSDYRRLPLVAAFAGFIVLPWLTRTVILTGWLLYPFPALDLFSFDWKVPVASVITEKLSVTGWARNPSEQHLAAAQMRVSEWFPLWFHNLRPVQKALFAGSLIAPACAFILLACKKIRMDFQARALVITSFCGVLFWFMLGPAIEFGIAFLLVAAISPLLYAPVGFPADWRPGGKLIGGLYVVLVMVNCSYARNITKYYHHRIAYLPQAIHIPQEVSFKTFSADGADIYVPINSTRCYDHELPCTPFQDDALKLRGHTLQAGFKH
jgi:hypothetical protein